MVRINVDIALQYDVGPSGADFIFNIQPSNFGHQTVISDELSVNQPVPIIKHTDSLTGNRTLRLHAEPGRLQIQTTSLVEINHLMVEGNTVGEMPVMNLPHSVLKYLLPSRYCQSDQFFEIARSEFQNMPPGYLRVQAICEWTKNYLTFTSGATNTTSTAVDVLLSKKGVCRDFAHLMIAVCRALNIPARFSTGTDYGADPSLGPPDFHAYVEAFVGNRWYLFDPSDTAIPMGVIRLGTGRDAADVPFATIFGSVLTATPLVSATSILSADIACYLPYRTALAISSDPFENAANPMLLTAAASSSNYVNQMAAQYETIS